jgi:hypothetical protein
MTRYLETLIAQARGAEPQIKPRLRSRFEAETPTMTEAAAEDIVRTEPAEPRAATVTATPPSPSTETSAEPVVPPAQSAAGLNRETVHHILEPTHRIERVERHTVERVVAHAVPPSTPERTIIVERLAQVPSDGAPRVPESGRDVIQPAPSPVTAQPAQPNARSEPPSIEKPALSADSAVPTRTAMPLPAAAEVAWERNGAISAGAAQDAPEITISIGVLDIRLTQEAPVERRPLARAQERRDNPLPLADYLARRSGSAS